MSAADKPVPAQDLLTFFRLVGQLKTTKRTGWVYRKVRQPESVSDHMYRMSMIAMAVSGSDLARDRIIKMALVHDLAEAEVGDIAPADNVSKEEKRALEEAAMRRIRDDILSGSALGAELYDLWLEYETGDTGEAKLLKEIDKMEMIIQADEYEKAQGQDLSEFFSSTQGVFKSPIMRGIDDVLRKEREERLVELPPHDRG